MDVGHPLVLGGVGVAGTDIAGLKLLKLLLRAEFVGLDPEEKLVLKEFGR